jgi:hypothetical protein
MRELLKESDHLGYISRLQIAAELDSGTIVQIDFAEAAAKRPIGLTMRRGWVPTRAQREFIDELRTAIPRNGNSEPMRLVGAR